MTNRGNVPNPFPDPLPSMGSFSPPGSDDGTEDYPIGSDYNDDLPVNDYSDLSNYGDYNSDLESNNYSEVENDYNYLKSEINNTYEDTTYEYDL